MNNKSNPRSVEVVEYWSDGKNPVLQQSNTPVPLFPSTIVTAFIHFTIVISIYFGNQ
jgi:hypothetical protein